MWALAGLLVFGIVLGGISLWVAGRYARMEAQAFNAYALADANDLAGFAGLPYPRQIHGVYELALAHQALLSLPEQEPWLLGPLYWNRQAARYRIAVSSRLAARLADRTARNLLATGAWPVPREHPPVASPSPDSVCLAEGRRVADAHDGSKVFWLIGTPAVLPAITGGAAPVPPVEAALLRSQAEGETFVGVLQTREGRCSPTALFRLPIPRRALLVPRTETDPVPDVSDVGATPDLSLVIQRNPSGQPSWGDRLIRLDWFVACRKAGGDGSAACGERSWVAEPVDLGWFSERGFQRSEDPAHDAVWQDRGDPSAEPPMPAGPRPVSVIAYDRPTVVRSGDQASLASRADFNPPAPSLVVADGNALVDAKSRCVVGRRQNGLRLTGWSVLEEGNRRWVAFVLSALTPNQGDFLLYTHFLRVVEIDGVLGCGPDRSVALSEQPVMEIGPFSAPEISGLAIGAPGSGLHDTLVLRYAEPIADHAVIPWGQQALKRKLCEVLNAHALTHGDYVGKSSSTAYRLLKSAGAKAIRTIEGGHAVCGKA
jgi:hypothetical protein